MLQNKENADDLMTQKAAYDAQEAALKEAEQRAEAQMRRKVATIGNLVHESVPTSLTEDDNLQIKMWHPDGPNAKVEKKTDILSHHEVMYKLDILDQDRGRLVLRSPLCV